MIGRPFRVEWRPEDTPEALKASYLAERDINLRTRLHGLWLLRSGRRLSAVASVLGVHYRTVQTWVGWYRDGGVEEVLSHKKGRRGTPRFLSTEEEQELAEEVSSGRFRTAGEIRDWIESEYEVSYKPGGVYSLLHRWDVHRRCLGVFMRKQTFWRRSPGKRGAWSRPCRSGSDIRDGLGVCR